MDVAEVRYPLILALILGYASHIDTYGDSDSAELLKVQQQISAVAEKDVAPYNLVEWWEEEGAEVLAFRIALPAPPQLNRHLTATELDAVVRRLPSGCFAGRDEFSQAFSAYLDSWYHQLLKLNAPFYVYQWFNRQKSADGQWFEYSNTEKVTLLSTGSLESR